MARERGHRPPRNTIWDGSYLTGRSLTMREYLDAVLRWVDGHYRERDDPLHRPFADDEARRESLKHHIQNREKRKMLRRFGDGDEWRAIKASTRGGQLE